MAISGPQKLGLRYPQAMALIAEGKASAQTLEAAQLMAGGLVFREIGVEMGISTSRAQELLRDPLLENAARRKARGLRPCADCGRPCNTDGRVTEVSERCARCAREKASAEAKWLPENIIAAMRLWADTHGGPPKAQDWHAGGGYTHPDYLAGDWPCVNTVKARFGTFNRGIRAAGMKPFREIGGQPRKPLSAKQLADTAALVEEYGLEQAAERLGLSKPGVERRLKQHKGQPTGDNKMPRELTAGQIIERELAKKLAKVDSMRSDLQNVEDEIERLKIAKSALSDGSAAVPSTA